MDRDDLVDDVMHKLKAALGEVEATGLRDAVRDGLREAMRALETPIEAPTDEAPANVVHLDPPTKATELTRPPVSVRVVGQSLDDGRLLCNGGAQTIYAGVLAATYRIVVDRGDLQVSVDERVVASVAPGQSSDVQGRMIRVSGDGQGRYRRLT
jgi:hypothetical protein